MRLFDSLLGPWRSGSLFTAANGHWQLMKSAILAGRDDVAQVELLAVVLLCQESIEISPRKQGDAYVLLTNALLRGSTVFGNADEHSLLRLSAAAIQRWWSLPHKKPPITKHYDQGLRWYSEVLDRLRSSGSANPEATMIEYESLYGARIATTSGYEDVENALFRFADDLPQQCETVSGHDVQPR